MNKTEFESAAPRSTFRVRFWGVRGSYPTTDRATLGVGGNTACVEVNAAGHQLIFDGGTGIIPLGKEICDGDSSRPTAYVFLSHTHLDHVMGLCFFEPLLTAEARSFIFGPGSSRGALARSLRQLTHSHLFPVSIDELKGRKEIYSLQGGEIICLPAPGKKPRFEKSRSFDRRETEEITITTCMSPAHPRFGVMLYRVNYRDKSLVYATDVEEKEGGYSAIIDFARGADLLIHDAQYRRDEYYSDSKPKKGWGHSTVEMAAEVAKKAGVKRLVLFHHEPTHDDKDIRRIERAAKNIFPRSLTAQEGMEISL
jgi:ribonuclease BN (tRNA processing enzyme)